MQIVMHIVNRPTLDTSRSHKQITHANLECALRAPQAVHTLTILKRQERNSGQNFVQRQLQTVLFVVRLGFAFAGLALLQVEAQVGLEHLVCRLAHR